MPSTAVEQFARDRLGDADLIKFTLELFNGVTARREGAATHARLIRVAPMGAALVDAAVLADRAPDSTVLTLTLQGNAWFNIYLVGAGPRDLAGPLSLMHVK